MLISAVKYRTALPCKDVSITLSKDLIGRVAKATNLTVEEAFSWIKAVLGVAGEKLKEEVDYNSTLNPFTQAGKRY